MKWLSNLFNHSCWLLAFSLCFFCSSNVLSQSCPDPYPVGNGSWSAWGNRFVATPELGCSDSERIMAQGGSGFVYDHMVQANSEQYMCYIRRVSDGVVFYASNSSRLPACATGYTENNGMCVPDGCTNCPSSGTSKNQTVALGGISGQQGIGASMCADSGGSECGVTCTSGIASYNEIADQSHVYCESYEFTGSACTNTSNMATPVSAVPSANQATPLNNPPKSRQDCPGGSGFAEVNNVGMCLPSGSQVSGGSTTQSSSGGSVTTSSVTTINSTGTNTTTTTTTYKDASGNVTYSGTGVSNSGINQAAAGGGTGQGDKPSLGDAPTFDQTLPQEATFNIKAQGNPVFSTEIFQAAASCPAPIPFTAMGQEFSIDFVTVCSFADVIRGMILLLSAVASLRIVTTS